MNENVIRVAKCCPNCGRRLFDKISLSKGFVEVKCPKCKHTYRFNLSMRRTRVPTEAFLRVGNW